MQNNEHQEPERDIESEEDNMIPGGSFSDGLGCHSRSLSDL